MYTIKPIDPFTASAADYLAALEFSNRIRAEIFPDDPPRTLQNIKASWRKMATFKKESNKCWRVMCADKHVAALWTFVSYYDDNRHLMNLELNVLPEHRQKGLAKRLLKFALEVAEEEKRTLIISWTHSPVPSGMAFAEHLGAKRGLEGHTNQLVLETLDRMLIASWIESAKHTAKEFTLDFWLEAYPEEEVDAIANMHNVMATAPRGELEIEDWQVNAEELRQGEDYDKAVGIERWVAYLRHVPTGELAGYSATYYQPDENMSVVNQGDTGVLPKFRGHGLGKWLKAAMLEKILRERPEVKFIRTGNADSNAPMLAINHALGFKPYMAWIDWQLETKQLKEYLQK
jgi:mycothiol synthase